MHNAHFNPSLAVSTNYLKEKTQNSQFLNVI